MRNKVPINSYGKVNTKVEAAVTKLKISV